MPAYLPFAGKNSIVEVSVGLQFAAPLDQKISPSVDAIKAEFAKELPKYEPMQTILVNVGIFPVVPPAAAAPSSSGVTGFNLSKLKNDGSPARLLRAMNNLLTIHFLEYEAWDKTKPDAVDYLRRCLSKLDVLASNPVIAILLRYMDRFTYDGDPETASTNGLLRNDSRFVPAQVINAGPHWHSNSGWYAPLIGATKTLNQLNIITGLAGTTLTVNIDHNSIYTLPRHYASLEQLFRGADGFTSVDSILDRQHAANTEVMKGLLVDELLIAIGLIKAKAA